MAGANGREDVRLFAAIHYRDDWLDVAANKLFDRLDRKLAEAHRLANLGTDPAAANYHDELLAHRGREAWAIREASLFRQIKR